MSALCLTAAAWLLGGCSSGPVSIDAPAVSGSARTACERLVADLPHQLAGQSSREVAPGDVLGAAWGDPAVTLTCGVARPADFNDTATCTVANGVGWFVPDHVLDDQSADVTMTTVGYRPMIQVHVPASYRPAGQADAMAALAGVVKRHLRLVQPCR